MSEPAIPAAIPASENERLKSLQNLNLLDTPTEARIDRFTHIASNLFNAPMATLSLIDADRQWFKSRIGIEASETPRKYAMCAHTILEHEALIVPDTEKDSRFVNNPMVVNPPNVRFYAGYPVYDNKGIALGAFCVLDTKPREFSEVEQESLKALASLVELELVNHSSHSMDTETQLSNKEGFFELAKHSQRICKKNGLSISVAFLFINGLLNYAQGTDTYQKVILLISESFRRNFRSSDVVGRYNSSGFIALLTNANEHTTKQKLATLSAEINQQLADTVEDCQCELISGHVTASAGENLEDLVFTAFTRINGE